MTSETTNPIWPPDPRRAPSGDFVLLCALPPEAIAVRAGLAARARRANPAVKGHVGLVGMGPRFARRAAGRYASSLPDGVPVVVMGVGGALTRGFSPGDLIVANALGIAGAEGEEPLEVTEAPAPLDERSSAFGERLFEALASVVPSTRLAPLLSAGRTARGPERSRLAESGAVICDTESAWLARLADRRPFAVVRSIVDTPERELMSLQTLTGGIVGLKRLTDVAGVVADVSALEDLRRAGPHPSL